MAGRCLFLKLDGAASKSTIYVDGNKVGSHAGAYSPHIADITRYVEPGGTHTVCVEVDNSDADVPPYSADFTFMGGLYRDVWLLALPQVHLGIADVPDCGFKVAAIPVRNGLWHVVVSGTLVNSSQRAASSRIRFVLLDPNGRKVAEADRTIRLKAGVAEPFDISIDDICTPALWCPESPELYKIVMSLEVDGVAVDNAECYTAFRTFGFDDDGCFLLNGSPLKLRGMCRHQDQRPMGIALDDDQHRRDMRMAKDLGANFIRISHYPQDDAVLEMCDRLGLIVWEEIPVIDYVPDSEAFADNCEQMLRDMIRNHYNHPSIAMWGYMNEILLRLPAAGRDATVGRTVALARRLEDVLHSEDSTRLSTMAFHGSDVYHDAALTDITEVQGWNLYQGWYGGQLSEFEQFLSRQHREHPSHRLIVSEYGAGSDLRLHSLQPEAFDFSVEYQQQYLEHYLPVIEDSIFIAGASHWNLIDFSSANRAESMPHINNKGILTNDRVPKDVYYYYKAKWHDSDSVCVAHIATRDWPVRTDLMFDNAPVIRPIKVYTNLDSVSLTVNGIRLPTAAVSNCVGVFDAPLRPGDNIITLSSSCDAGSVLDAAVVKLDAIAVHGGIIDLSTGSLAVNVGSGCYYRSDDTGLTWLPDCEYAQGIGYGHIGGRQVSTQDEIALTTDQPLLQRSLAGHGAYRFDVPDGRYEVELLFADPSSPSAQSAYMLGRNAGTSDAGVPDMDIFVNGKRVERHFVPGAVAGVKTMVKRRYDAEATGSAGVCITFKSAPGATTTLSAIKIRKL